MFHDFIYIINVWPYIYKVITFIKIIENNQHNFQNVSLFPVDMFSGVSTQIETDI